METLEKNLFLLSCPKDLRLTSEGKGFFSKNTRLKNQVAIHTSNSGDEANEYADMDRIGTEGDLIWNPKFPLSSIIPCHMMPLNTAP